MTDSSKKMSKGDDPKDFSADAVEEYVKGVDDKEEVSRVGAAESDGKDRKGVTFAVNSRSGELDGSDDSSVKNEGDGEPVVEKGPDEKPREDGMNETLPTDEVTVDKNPENVDRESLDDYDPYTDPAVPSSVIASAIATEIAGGGDTPTLDAVKDAAAQAK